MVAGAETIYCSNPGNTQHGSPDENLGAINIQLTSADLRELNTHLSKIKIHGGRMNEMQMQVVDK